MEPGRLRHIVDIEAPIETVNSTGEIEWPFAVWAASVRASIEDLSSRERELARQVAGEVTTRIRIRYRPGVTEKMRIRHVRENTGSPNVFDFYEILGITRDLETSRRELQLLCLLRSEEGYRRGEST